MRAIALVALLAGCSAAPTITSAPVTPQVVYVTPAPEPTAAPTEEPTPEPTAAPTMRPLPTARATEAVLPPDDEEFDELLEGLTFLGMGIGFLDAFDPLWTRATNQVGNGNWSGMADTVDDLQAVVDDHQRWLQQNPPVDCTRLAHSYWVTAMDEFDEGLGDMAYGLMPPVTQSDLISGITKITGALDWINDATDAIDCGDV